MSDKQAYNPTVSTGFGITDQKQHTALSGQQMQALLKQMSDELAKIRKDVELRKWAVDQACGLAGAAYEGGLPAVDAVALAKAIHAFLVDGADQPKADTKIA